MKKYILVFILFFHITALFASENNFGLSLGVFGLCYDTAIDAEGVCVYAHAPAFMYQSWFGFGFVFSPANYTQSLKTSYNYLLTFVNASINYNFFNSLDLLLGPFVSVNALSLNRPDFFSLQAGIVFSCRLAKEEELYLYSNHNSIFTPEIIYAVIGYKYSNNYKHGFFTTVAVDFAGLLYIFALIFG